MDSCNSFTRYSKIWTHKRKKWGESTQNFTDRSYGNNIKSSVASKRCNYFPKLHKWEIYFSHQNSTNYIFYYFWNYYISKLFQRVCYLDSNGVRMKKRILGEMKSSVRDRM